MKIGDKVRVLDEEGIFIIKKIDKTKVILLDEYGFENSYPIIKLTPYNIFEDMDFDIREIIKEKDDVSERNKKARNKDEKIREIDLHIGNLVESIKNMLPYQMLQKQLNIANLEIEKARREKVEKLILIHGKGKGVLKIEIYKLLETIDRIEYFEADIIKYRFGAVEIRFK